jgi:hypothetical protein
MTTTILDKRIINLASSHGSNINGTLKSNLGFFFQNLLKDEPSIAYVEVGVVSCEIPVSFYTINENNDTIDAILYPTVGSPIPKTIVLSNGNYTATTFLTEFKLKVQLAYLADNPTNIILLDTGFNRINGLVSFSLPANATFSQIDFLDSALRQLIGFSSTTSLELFENATPTIATFPINLLGVNKINICSNELLTYNYQSGSSGFSNVLASIEVNATPYGIILYRNQSLTYNILRVKELENFDIQLKDPDNNFLNLNNQDWTITLGLNIYRYMPQFSQSSFSDVLGIKPIVPPIKDEPKKVPPKKDDTLELLTMS